MANDKKQASHIDSRKNRTELLAPAGDLSTAIRAYEAGADAVYLGLQCFSARKGARNFSLSEVRRLKHYATQHAKCFYVALNTIIEDQEIPTLVTLLTELELIKIDGIIVQDLGVAKLVHDFFPTIPLHASTQMAIHNSAGLSMAKQTGITRVWIAPGASNSDLRG